MGSAKKTSAIVVVAITVLAAVYTLIAGNQPLLGLDLQGGVSVVLQPTAVVDPDTGEERDLDEEALDQTVEIIRSRVDALGVAEPEISRQGSTIVVDLPGVKEQQRALELVGQTAELRFRPVLFPLGPELTFDPELDTDGDEGDADTQDADTEDTDTEDTEDGGTLDGDEEDSLAPVSGRFAPIQDPTTSTTTADDEDTTTSEAEAEDTDTSATDTSEAEDADSSTSSTVADEDETPADGEDETDDTTTFVPPTEQGTVDPEELAIIEACSIPGITPPEEDFADRPVVLVDETGTRLCLGPTLLTGDALETAGVNIDQSGQWTVNPTFRQGAGGIDLFNEAASLCFTGSVVCPPVAQGAPGRLAIVLDHEVVSAPSINAPIFGRDQIVISGSFDEDSARDLASVLRFGALPLELETQQTRTVSATIGDDVLRSGVIAGLIGLSLVAVYLLAYYRLAGLVAIAGLLISAVLLWAIISWFGENLGLALTLAGVVGLIVSVGVSADSNIVYFENVKDSYRSGRKVPTAVERAYQTAISTIVKADVVSLIAAALLYLLTVGAVRGFAFYLGLATLLDLFISWLFMRPALAFLARRQAVENNPRLLGLPTAPKNTEPVTTAGGEK